MSYEWKGGDKVVRHTEAKAEAWYLTTSGRGTIHPPFRLADETAAEIRGHGVAMLEFPTEEAAEAVRTFITHVIGECLLHSNLAPLIEAIAAAKDA
jgi:hypothetical protein